MVPRTRHPRRLSPPTVSVTTCVHGPSDRGKDASPWREGFFSPSRRVPTTLIREPTTFPFSAPEEHPLSSVRCRKRRRPPSDTPDRPRPPFRPYPAKGIGFPETRCFPPLRLEVRGRIAPSGVSAGLPLTPPTRFPPSGERCFFGPCKRAAWCYPRKTHSGVRTPFCPLVLPRLGLTTQARQRGSVGGSLTGSD